MKKLTVFLLAFVFAAFIKADAVYAKLGDIGFFGGVSEGRKLPRTTEQLFAANAARDDGATVTFAYKEMIFVHGGEPVAFEGLIDITHNGIVAGELGSFNIEYEVYPSADALEGEPIIEREANLAGTFRKVGNQYLIYLEMERSSWDEEITVNGVTYTLDNQQSVYQTSIIEDQTPGVNYHRGDVSGRLVYTSGEGEAAQTVTAEVTGPFHGFDSAWASTETHRYNVSLMTDDWGMQYEVRPSVTVNKVLQYTANEPEVISFEGNYKEVLQNFAGLNYDIFTWPQDLWYIPKNGTESISVVNTFEQLPEPDLTFLRGNAAEDDIRRLFAMQILTGDPRYYNPSQAISRGQFMTALARAIKLPIEDPADNIRALRLRPSVTISLFSDVDTTRPEFPYIDAIQKAGIAFGRDDGSFHFDFPIERQEAFTVLVRALGLTNMGLNPTVVTPFTDSDEIASWAIREAGVAQMIGLIAPDEYGRIYPKQYISKGEAAALFNFFIDFMRNGLISYYADQIVNIAS